MRFAGTPVFALVVLLGSIDFTEGVRPVAACRPGDIIDEKLAEPGCEIYWIDRSSGDPVIKEIEGIWDFLHRGDSMLGYGRPYQGMRAMRNRNGIPFIIRGNDRETIGENELSQYGIGGIMPPHPNDEHGNRAHRFQVYEG